MLHCDINISLFMEEEENVLTNMNYLTSKPYLDKMLLAITTQKLALNYRYFYNDRESPKCYIVTSY